jgi:pyrimidine operon attenuation protein/uracil phosphoribosyltransferase
MSDCDDNSIDIDKTIIAMAEQISALNLPDPLLIGIHTGGVWVAERLHQLLGCNEQLGTLDISFYRDDFSRVGLNPEVKTSALPTAVENRNIILIDDVLYTGRTIRAAMNEIFSYGRPNIVKLGVLIERSGREILIQADITGCAMDLDESQQAKLVNQDGELKLNVITTGKQA